jgi:hypothetical protein
MIIKKEEKFPIHWTNIDYKSWLHKEQKYDPEQIKTTKGKKSLVHGIKSWQQKQEQKFSIHKTKIN